MRYRILFAFFAASVVGCSSGSDAPAPSTCEVATKVTLPSSPLTTSSNLRIQRAGEGFLLTTRSSNGGSEAPWARSSELGELGPVAVATSMSWYLGLAAVGKDSAADQLVATDRGPTLEEGVVAAVVDEQTGVPGPGNAVLAASYYGQVTELGMASSLDGRRALYVHANRVIDDPKAIVLGGDAVRNGDPVTVTTSVDHLWNCLDVIPTDEAGAISLVESRDGRRLWRVVELDATGAQVFEGSVDITEEVGEPPGGLATCPSVAVTLEGFTALLGGAVEPAIVVEIDRATFAAEGAKRIELMEGEEPVGGASAIASMGGGYAVHFRRGADGSRHIGFFDGSGRAGTGAVQLAAEVSVGGPIHSAPGVLLLSFREGDGRWGWLEATCRPAP